MADIAATARMLHLCLAALLLPSVVRAASPFDGTYVGKQTLTVDDQSAACGRSRDVARTITVADGKFDITWAGNSLSVVLHPDGSFRETTLRAQTTTAARVIRISGRVDGQFLKAEFGHEKCAVAMSLQRQ